MTLSTHITSGFWRARLDLNAATAIFYQWEQLEASRCLDNFRIAAGQKDGFREGFYFADSDAYKWLEAASRILAETPDPRLKALVDELIALLEAVQQPDGYIDTYNQLHFPGQRWVNLQIEHEFYCLGHLIEAGIAHHAATGETRLLALVRRAANLLVRDFMDAPAAQTDGHEEIELALIRLYRHTSEPTYLELARRLLERRGRVPAFPLVYWQQAKSAAQRKQTIAAQRAVYLQKHPEDAGFHLAGDNPSVSPPFAKLRRQLDHYSGKYFQQNRPIRQQTSAVGHSVRFGYLQTAVAMLARETGDASLRTALEALWEQMVTRRMYVTGGLGALPFTEGFGRDFELDPEYAYAETCAALASLFWGDEMARLTHRPRYADLFEWQLYNAASVGIAIDGQSYFYNNPLTCRGAVTRAGWYVVPCCPSNLSRTWAALGSYVFNEADTGLWINHYISSETSFWKLRMEADLPWGGTVKLTLADPLENPATLHLRIPSWAAAYTLTFNGQPLQPDSVSAVEPVPESACGYNPSAARTLSITRAWRPGDELTLTFDLSIRLLRQSPRLPRCGGQVAVTRGPLVYCLESLDQPELDIFNVTIDSTSLQAVHDDRLLGGLVKITGKTVTGQPLTFIPYLLWGNRGPSTMTVFVRD